VLEEIVSEVFGPRRYPRYTEAFGAQNGAAILERHFADVEWHEQEGSLLCTGADDVLAYIVSIPPGERATADEIERLRAAIGERFAAGHGRFPVTRESGAFVCRVA
jgi:hypothetical protein